MSPIEANNTCHAEASLVQSPNVGFRNSNKSEKQSWRCQAFAKRSRRRVHTSFFKLGCFIQRHYIGVFIFGVSILSMFLIGLKDMSVEHDIPKMWIETGGRLQEELAYTEGFWGKQGYGSELQVLIQVKSNEKSANLLHPDALLEHLEILKKVKNLRINKFYSDWSLYDFCFKYDVPFTATREVYLQIKKLMPCVIMTPLDCFWEGSLIASPDTKYEEFSWTKNSPMEFLDLIKEMPLLQNDYNQSLKFMKKAGIYNGYLGKPCLNQNNQRCLKHQKNMESNLGLHLSKGCYGIAENYMHWPKEMIVSGLTTDLIGHRADALQSVIQIFDAQNFYKSALDNQFYNDELKSKLNSIEGGFTLEAAAEILRDWKIEYTKLVNSELLKNSMKYTFLAFSTSSFTELVEEMTSLNKKNMIIAGVVVAAYAVISLKRWSKGVYSYGSVGLVGVILGCLSVASGLGLSSIVKMKLTAVSAQVLPFLALGFGMDNIFLLARTYVFVCDAGIEDKRIVGMCLGECGLSIAITSIATVCGLLSASLMQITTLQTFIYQAVLIMVVFWFAVTMIFPSVLALDVERLKIKRYDLCCCLGEIDDIDKESPSLSLKNQFPNNFGSFKNQPFVVGNSSFAVKQKNFQLTRTHRQFNVKQKVCPNEKKLTKSEPSNIELWLKKLSITYFAQNYFGEWVIEVQLKIIIMFVCCIQLFLAGYGTAKVYQGLDLGEMVPRESSQYKFLNARQKYFSFYQVHVVTKGKLNGKIFDYASNQLLLMEFYTRITKLPFVVNDKEEKEPTFWLPIYRNWLQEFHSRGISEERYH